MKCSELTESNKDEMQWFIITSIFPIFFLIQFLKITSDLAQVITLIPQWCSVIIKQQVSISSVVLKFAIQP